MDLTEALKVALADTYVFAIKAQNFHWNVRSTSFSEYHKFFDEIYNEVSDAADGIAESIRTLDAFAPGSMIRFLELTTIQEEKNVPEALMMITKLANDNERVLASLNRAYALAERDRKFGISNFIQDRITAHEKWGWMLRSFIKV
jgi:starvation-inducible DNA-binding protein